VGGLALTLNPSPEGRGTLSFVFFSFRGEGLRDVV
jgi:hypothetical protein